jgi:hypothetical protein
VLGALLGFVAGQTHDVIPLDDLGAAAPQAPAPDVHLAHEPVAGAVLLDADVHDHHALPAVAQIDLAVEELGHDEGLARPLLEAAHVDGSGRDHLT